MSRRMSRLAMPVSLIATALTFALAAVGPAFDLIRLRSVLLIAVVPAAVILARAFSRRWRPRLSARISAIIALQLGLIVLVHSAQPAATRTYESLGLLLATGVGWLAWIELFAARTRRPALHVDSWADRVNAAAPLVLALLLGLLFHSAIEGELVSTTDEILHRMQARALAAGSPAFAIDAAMQPSFQLSLASWRDEGLVSQYAPGWPLLLSVAYVFGAERAAALVIGLLNIVLTQRIGTRIAGRGAGLVAACFVALHPIVLRYGPTYLPHAATLFFLLAACLALLEARERAAAGRPGEHALTIATGLLLGAAVLTRPLTGAAIGLSIVVWIHLRNGRQASDLFAAVPLLLIGALPALLTWAIYHDWVFGSPHVSGSAIMQALMSDAGVAERAVADPAAIAAMTGSGAAQYLGEVQLGIANTLRASWATFGVLGVFAFLALLTSAGMRFRLRAVLPFVLLPVLHLLYFHSSYPRLHFELMPFVGIAIGWAFVELRRLDVRVATAMVSLVLAGNIVVAASLLRMLRTEAAESRVLYTAVSQARVTHGQVLVIVPRDAPDHVVARLFTYNLDGTGGDVVVAREADAASNLHLLERFGAYTPLVLRTAGPLQYRLVRVDGTALLATGTTDRSGIRWGGGE
jgi:4-amino-4-deoxy-L-arabinose transferase-like glycosyltransferase